MKHYGALLTGVNNEVDGGADSVLTVGDNDAIIIRAPRLSTAADLGDDITDAEALAASGLVIATANGATHVLGADGREVAIAGFGSVNTVTARVPVKGVDTNGNAIYVNSIITETHATVDGLNYDENTDLATTATLSNAQGVNIAGNLSISGTTTIGGNLEVTGTTNFRHSSTTTYSDTFIELNVAQDITDSDDPNYNATVTGGVGGILVESNYNRASGVVTATKLGGLRFNGDYDTPGTTDNVGRWEYNNGITDVNDPNGTGSWVPFSEAVVETVRGGNGITVATSGTIDGLTASAENPVVSIALTADGPGAGGLVLTNPADTGTAATDNGNQTLGIDVNGITEQMLNVPGDAGVAGNILSLVDPTAGTFAWVAAGGTGNVNKYARNFQADAAGTITITRGAGQTNTTHGFSGSDFSVIVYEILNSSGTKITNTAPDAGDNSVTDATSLSQVIPESTVINISTGEVVVTLGTTEATNPIRVVIKS